MSDIDPDLRMICRIVVEKMPCSCPPGIDPQFDDVCANCNAHDDAIEVARAVAERVMERARVCSWCHGSGLHPGPYDDVPTCDRCAGRGVTFGGEA